MPVSESKTRIQISIPNELLKQMDEKRAEFGFSRSTYITSLVAKDMQDTEKVINSFKLMLKEAGLTLDEQ